MRYASCLPTILLIATAGVVSGALCSISFEGWKDPVAPTFTAGADGAPGQSPGAAGNDGSPQPTPQTATLDQSGDYPAIVCQRGGHGGNGADGHPEGVRNGGKGGNGKDGAEITFFINASGVHLTTVDAPGGGNGGHGGNGAAPGGKGGAGGAAGSKGSVHFVLQPGVTGFQVDQMNGGNDGTPGTPGADAQ